MIIFVNHRIGPAKPFSLCYGGFVAETLSAMGKGLLMDTKQISLSSEPKLKGESTKKWVYRSLSRAIMSGRFPPGLPVTISGLSESLGVSTMPVRGALDQLIADGALEYLDNRRVRVPDIGPERFDELIATRIALETVAAERAMHFIDFLRIDRLVALDNLIDEAYQAGDIELNSGRKTVTLDVTNTGDRPVQVGSHYHFFETNPALKFERATAKGFRLDIAAGTAVRFEPGQTRSVTLVELAGKRAIYGFRQAVMGKLK